MLSLRALLSMLRMSVIVALVGVQRCRCLCRSLRRLTRVVCVLEDLSIDAVRYLDVKAPVVRWRCSSQHIRLVTTNAVTKTCNNQDEIVESIINIAFLTWKSRRISSESTFITVWYHFIRYSTMTHLSFFASKHKQNGGRACEWSVSLHEACEWSVYLFWSSH